MSAIDRGWPEAGDGSCCFGATVYGPGYCTCWEPVYDLDQAAPDTTATPGVMPRRCSDCAYLRKSPERSDEYAAEWLDRIAATGERFWCHDGPDNPGKVTRWILRRVIESRSADRSEWASVSSTLGAGIRRAMDASAAEAESSSFTDSPMKLPTGRSQSGSSSCTHATTRHASLSDISSPEACLTTTLTWLRRGGLNVDLESRTIAPDSAIWRLLRSVADELLAKRRDPWAQSSESATPISADSPDRCDALFERMRRPTSWRHPSGATIPGDHADYQPPIIDGVPYRADGRPGDLCAGWTARALKASWEADR